MSGTEQRTWIQKSHSNQYTFHLFFKTLQWIQPSAHLSSGRVGHLEALTWSCLFPPYIWNISRSIQTPFQFHSHFFLGNTLLSTQLTFHWYRTHGKAVALKKGSYNFSAAEKGQGLVKGDIFQPKFMKTTVYSLFSKKWVTHFQTTSFEKSTKASCNPSHPGERLCKNLTSLQDLDVHQVLLQTKFPHCPILLNWTGQLLPRFCSHYHCCSRVPISESTQTGFFV